MRNRTLLIVFALILLALYAWMGSDGLKHMPETEGQMDLLVGAVIFAAIIAGGAALARSR